MIRSRVTSVLPSLCSHQTVFFSSLRFRRPGDATARGCHFSSTELSLLSRTYACWHPFKHQLQSGEARTREACHFDSCRAVFQFSFPQLFKGFAERQNATDTAPAALCCSDRSPLWNYCPTSPQDADWKSFPACEKQPFPGSVFLPSTCCGSVSARAPLR